jgi:predicted nucleotidyltransferase
MRPSDALTIYGESLRALASKWGFPEVRVFGSTARGEDREDSDLDLLVHLGSEDKFFDAFTFMVEAKAMCAGVSLDGIIDIMAKPEVLASAMSEGYLL